jgi:hypothetical protein
MAIFKVKHLVLCEVRVWRTIEADNFDAALLKVAAIEYVTDTSTGADHEVINDIKIESVTITEQQ